MFFCCQCENIAMLQLYLKNPHWRFIISLWPNATENSIPFHKLHHVRQFKCTKWNSTSWNVDRNMISPLAHQFDEYISVVNLFSKICSISHIQQVSFEHFSDQITRTENNHFIYSFFSRTEQLNTVDNLVSTEFYNEKWQLKDSTFWEKKLRAYENCH